MDCRTKIVATLGPASNTAAIIEQLIRAGMDIARLNFSHGTTEDHRRMISNVHTASENAGKDIGILLDLQGPKIRIGRLETDAIHLEEGAQFTITTRDITGNEREVSTNYTPLPQEISVGSHILLDDGLLELEVLKTTGTDIICNIIRGGRLTEKKGINVPGAQLSVRSLSEKDKDDLPTGMRQVVDKVAISFIRTDEE